MWRYESHTTSWDVANRPSRDHWLRLGLPLLVQQNTQFLNRVVCRTRRHKQPFRAGKKHLTKRHKWNVPTKVPSCPPSCLVSLTIFEDIWCYWLNFTQSQDLNQDSIRNVLSSIQCEIQRKDDQMSWVDSCCLQLRLDKTVFAFQMESPEARKEWTTG